MPRDTLGVLGDIVLCRFASFFSSDIEFFQRIPNTMSGDTKVRSTLLLGRIWKISDVLLECLVIKASGPSGSRFDRSEWVLSLQPVIDARPRDPEPS